MQANWCWSFLENNGVLSRLHAWWGQFALKRDSLPCAWLLGIRATFLVAAAFLGCVLVELPWRENFEDFDSWFFFCNVVLCGFVLAVVYLAGQCTRASIVVFLAVCLTVGAALHFVVEFKGQVILPADVAAVGTALSVSQGYSYEIDDRLWTCIGLFAAYCVVLGALCPRIPLRWRGRIAAAVAAISLTLAGGAAVAFVQVDEALDFEVSNWAPGSSYRQQGALLSFVALAQDARTPVPAGYSAERAQEILSEYPDERATWLASEEEGALSAEQLPTVIVVMNESFADLSVLGADGTEALAPSACRTIAANSLLSGTALASVFGGGTCNSEFEFLTGTSMAFQSGGYYPYMFQNFSQCDTVPRYFQSIGYRTVALHPNWPANWQRDRVYPEMGFDEFLSNGSWEDAERVRGEVRDSEVYSKLLELVAESESPQFLFAITMANHGGYETEVEPEYQADVAEDLEGKMGVYADLLQLADGDLKSFADALQGLDEPVVLCFFGDHQPSAAEELLGETETRPMDAAPSLGDLAEVEQCYEVPYFIWENEAQKAARQRQAANREGACGLEAQNAPTSLCYLSAQLVQAAELPQTPFMQLAVATHSQYPLFNAIGYWNDGQWKPYSVSDMDPTALNDYAIASYALLTGKSS